MTTEITCHWSANPTLNSSTQPKCSEAAEKVTSGFVVSLVQLLGCNFPMVFDVRNDDDGWNHCSDRTANGTGDSRWSRPVLYLNQYRYPAKNIH